MVMAASRSASGDPAPRPPAGSAARAVTGRPARRAARGLVAGTLVAGPIALATAAPAQAAAAGRPVDIHVDLGGPGPGMPSFDPAVLGRLAQAISGLVNAAASATATSHPVTAHSSSARSRSSRTGTGAAPVLAAPIRGTGLGGGTGAVSAAATAAPTAAASVSPAGAVSSAPAPPAPLAAGDGPRPASTRPAVAAQPLVAPDDRDSITALDVLAGLLAGTVFIGLPAAGLVRRRTAR
jgi:hypothetical protein